jgi:hypothetical protein
MLKKNKCIKCEKDAVIIGIGLGGSANLCQKHFNELVEKVKA